MKPTSVFLQALFEPILHNDHQAIQAILVAANVLDESSRAALHRFVADPIGVRSWALTERAFFTGEKFPFVSPRAMLRLREARVAAAYELREEASEALAAGLRMPADRLEQVLRALQVYEEGIKSAFRESPPPVIVAEPAPNGPLVDDVVVASDVVVEPVVVAEKLAAPKKKKVAVAPAAAAKARGKARSKVKPRSKGKSGSASP